MCSSFRKHIICKIIALAVSFAFIWQSIALAGEVYAQNLSGAASSGILSGKGKIDIDSIKVPVRLGEVVASFKGSLGKTIIHIRDAHCDYYAQHSIAGVIGYFRGAYGVDLVALEGGSGDYDLSVFTRIKDKNIRDRVANYFLREGEVNGAEYYAINNPESVALYGIENTTLYMKNLHAYRDSLEFKKDADKCISALTGSVRAIKERLYSDQLKSLDEKSKQFKSGKIDLKDYALSMVGLAKKFNMNIGRYPGIALFLRIMDEEKAINLKEAERERNILLDMLNKRLSRRYLEELVANTVAFNNGDMAADAYYEYLFDKCELCGIELDKTPSLTKYAACIKLSKEINKKELSSEFKALEAELFNHLCETPEQKEVLSLDNRLFILRGLFSVDLDKDSWDYYASHKEEFGSKNLASFIYSNGKLDCDIGRLDSYRERMEKFYLLSLERDNAFIDNISRKMKSEKSGSIVLVTGGFHQERLKGLFKEKGYSYVEIMPKVDRQDGQSHYFRLLSGGLDPITRAISEKRSSLQIATFFDGKLSEDVYGPNIKTSFDAAVNVVKGLIEKGSADIGGIHFSFSPDGGELFKVNGENVLVEGRAVYLSGAAQGPAPVPAGVTPKTPATSATPSLPVTPTPPVTPPAPAQTTTPSAPTDKGVVAPMPLWVGVPAFAAMLAMLGVISPGAAILIAIASLAGYMGYRAYRYLMAVKSARPVTIQATERTTVPTAPSVVTQGPNTIFLRDKIGAENLDITIYKEPMAPTSLTGALDKEMSLCKINARYRGHQFNLFIAREKFRDLTQTDILEAVKHYVSLYEKGFEKIRLLGGDVPAHIVFNTFFAETGVRAPMAKMLGNESSVFMHTLPFEATQDDGRDETFLHELGHNLTILNTTKFSDPRVKFMGEGIADYIAGIYFPDGRDRSGADYRIKITEEQSKGMEGLSQLSVDVSIWGRSIANESRNGYFGRTHHNFGREFIHAFIDTFGEGKLFEFLKTLSNTKMMPPDKDLGTEWVRQAFNALGYNQQQIETFKSKLYERLRRNVFEIVRASPEDKYLRTEQAPSQPSSGTGAGLGGGSSEVKIDPKDVIFNQPPLEEIKAKLPESKAPTTSIGLPEVPPLTDLRSFMSVLRAGEHSTAVPAGKGVVAPMPLWVGVPAFAAMLAMLGVISPGVVPAVMLVTVIGYSGYKLYKALGASNAMSRAPAKKAEMATGSEEIGEGIKQKIRELLLVTEDSDRANDTKRDIGESLKRMVPDATSEQIVSAVRPLVDAIIQTAGDDGAAKLAIEKAQEALVFVLVVPQASQEQLAPTIKLLIDKLIEINIAGDSASYAKMAIIEILEALTHKANSKQLDSINRLLINASAQIIAGYGKAGNDASVALRAGSVLKSIATRATPEQLDPAIRLLIDSLGRIKEDSDGANRAKIAIADFLAEALPRGAPEYIALAIQPLIGALIQIKGDGEIARFAKGEIRNVFRAIALVLQNASEGIDDVTFFLFLDNYALYSDEPETISVFENVISRYRSQEKFLRVRRLAYKEDMAALRNMLTSGELDEKLLVRAILLNNQNRIITQTSDLLLKLGVDKGIPNGMLPLSPAVGGHKEFSLNELNDILSKCGLNILSADSLKEYGFRISSEGNIIPFVMDVLLSTYRGSATVDSVNASYLTHAPTTAIIKYAVKKGEAAKYHGAEGEAALHEFDQGLLNLLGENNRKVDGSVTLAFSYPSDKSMPDYARKRTIELRGKTIAEHFQQLMQWQLRERYAKQNILKLLHKISKGEISSADLSATLEKIRENIRVLYEDCGLNKPYVDFLFGYLNNTFYEEVGARYSQGDDNRQMLINLFTSLMADYNVIYRVRRQPQAVDSVIRHTWQNAKVGTDARAEQLCLLTYLENEERLRIGTFDEVELGDISNVSLSGQDAKFLAPAGIGGMAPKGVVEESKLQTEGNIYNEIPGGSYSRVYMSSRGDNVLKILREDVADKIGTDRILLPPSREEQGAIAKALNGGDEQLAARTRLAKKGERITISEKGTEREYIAKGNELIQEAIIPLDQAIKNIFTSALSQEEKLSKARDLLNKFVTLQKKIWKAGYFDGDAKFENYGVLVAGDEMRVVACDFDYISSLGADAKKALMQDELAVRLSAFIRKSMLEDDIDYLDSVDKALVNAFRDELVAEGLLTIEQNKLLEEMLKERGDNYLKKEAGDVPLSEQDEEKRLAENLAALQARDAAWQAKFEALAGRIEKHLRTVIVDSSAREPKPIVLSGATMTQPYAQGRPLSDQLKALINQLRGKDASFIVANNFKDLFGDVSEGSVGYQARKIVDFCNSHPDSEETQEILKQLKEGLGSTDRMAQVFYSVLLFELSPQLKKKVFLDNSKTFLSLVLSGDFFYVPSDFPYTVSELCDDGEKEGIRTLLFEELNKAIERREPANQRRALGWILCFNPDLKFVRDNLESVIQSLAIIYYLKHLPVQEHTKDKLGFLLARAEKERNSQKEEHARLGKEGDPQDLKLCESMIKYWSEVISLIRTDEAFDITKEDAPELLINQDPQKAFAYLKEKFEATMDPSYLMIMAGIKFNDRIEAALSYAMREFSKLYEESMRSIQQGKPSRIKYYDLIEVNTLIRIIASTHTADTIFGYIAGKDKFSGGIAFSAIVARLGADKDSLWAMDMKNVKTEAKNVYERPVRPISFGELNAEQGDLYNRYRDSIKNGRNDPIGALNGQDVSIQDGKIFVMYTMGEGLNAGERIDRPALYLRFSGSSYMAFYLSSGQSEAGIRGTWYPFYGMEKEGDLYFIRKGSKIEDNMNDTVLRLRALLFYYYALNPVSRSYTDKVGEDDNAADYKDIMFFDGVDRGMRARLKELGLNEIKSEGLTEQSTEYRFSSGEIVKIREAAGLMKQLIAAGEAKNWDEFEKVGNDIIYMLRDAPKPGSPLWRFFQQFRLKDMNAKVSLDIVNHLMGAFNTLQLIRDGSPEAQGELDKTMSECLEAAKIIEQKINDALSQIGDKGIGLQTMSIAPTLLVPEVQKEVPGQLISGSGVSAPNPLDAQREEERRRIAVASEEVRRKLAGVQAAVGTVDSEFLTSIPQISKSIDEISSDQVKKMKKMEEGEKVYIVEWQGREYIEKPVAPPVSPGWDDEIQRLKKLENVPNVPRIAALVSYPDGTRTFIMIKIEGEKLSETSRTLGADFFSKLRSIVSEAHKRGVIHLDLQSTDILVLPNGDPTIIDWGVQLNEEESYDEYRQTDFEALDKIEKEYMERIGERENSLVADISRTKIEPYIEERAATRKKYIPPEKFLEARRSIRSLLESLKTDNARRELLKVIAQLAVLAPEPIHVRLIEDLMIDYNIKDRFPEESKLIHSAILASRVSAEPPKAIISGDTSYDKIAEEMPAKSKAAEKILGNIFRGKDYRVIVSGAEPTDDKGNVDISFATSGRLTGERNEAGRYLNERLGMGIYLAHTVGLDAAKNEILNIAKDKKAPELISYTISASILQELEDLYKNDQGFREALGAETVEQFLRNTTTLDILIDSKESNGKNIVYLLPYFDATVAGLSRLNLIDLLTPKNGKTRDLTDPDCRQAFDDFCRAVSLLSGHDVSEQFASAMGNNDPLHFFKTYNIKLIIPRAAPIDINGLHRAVEAMKEAWRSL